MFDSTSFLSYGSSSSVSSFYLYTDPHITIKPSFPDTISSSTTESKNSIIEEYLKIENTCSRGKMDFKRNSITDFALLDFEENDSDKIHTPQISPIKQEQFVSCTNPSKLKNSAKKILSLTCEIL